MTDQPPSDSLNDDAKKAHEIFSKRMNTVEDDDGLVLSGSMSIEEIKAQVKEMRERLRAEQVAKNNKL